MPDLNIKGSTLDNFGEHLPTPVIEYVGIRNDKIEVQVSLYFDFTDLEKDTDTFLEYFNDPTKAPLYITVAYVIGENEAQAIIDKTQADIFKELYEDPRHTNASTAEFQFNDNSWGHATHSNYNTVLFDVSNPNWKISDQNFYTDDNKKLVQYKSKII